jgi:peptidoglycan/LPS O-acetylase OafA/YrhL
VPENSPFDIDLLQMLMRSCRRCHRVPAPFKKESFQLPRYFKLSIEDNRVFGLDILRAIAILCVVLGHSLSFVPPGIFSRIAGLAVFDGVSIFFVLSGFLIGGILIKTLEKNPPELKVLLHFWTRRWFRTLPAYYLVLIAVVACTVLFGRFMSVPQSFTFANLKLFIFTQNWSSPHPNFFPEAWSLSIEEWYYVLIPSVLFLSVKMLRISPKQSIVYVACAVIFAVTLVRYVRFAGGQYSTYDEWDTVFRKQVITRLDSLMFGMLGAFCSYYYPRLWRSNKKPLLAVGVLLLVVARYSPEIIRTASVGFYNSVLSFTVLSVGVLLCLPFLSDYTDKGSIVYIPMTYISMCSYSMYLLNFTPIAHFGIGVVKRFAGISTPTVLYPVYWVIVMGSSILMYKYFENPTTDLRSKLFTKAALVQPVVQVQLSRTARGKAGQQISGELNYVHNVGMEEGLHDVVQSWRQKQ